MTRGARFRWMRVALRLLAVCCLGWLMGGSAFASQLRALPTEEVYQHCALIAHVRVAGEVKFGHRRTQFVEVLDAARGPARGEIAVVACDEMDDDELPAWKVGQQFLLFATLKDDGLYHPLPIEHSPWPVKKDGALAESDLPRAFVPPSTPPTAAGVMAILRNECRRRDVQIRVRLNENDVRNDEPDAPLRVKISIDNVGDAKFSFANHIEYEYYHPFENVDAERLRELRNSSSAPEVKLCLRRLERHQLDLRRLERRLSEAVSLAPGQQAVATYDLAQQYDIRRGGRFLVWAEVGPHRSPPTLLELPVAEIAAEAVALAEVAVDDGGPFHIVEGEPRPHRGMPPVGPTVEAAAIEAALACWRRQRYFRPEAAKQPTEIAFLRHDNLPAGFSPRIPGVQFALTDIGWAKDGSPTELETSRGPALFRWRTLRIRSVNVRGQRATVELRQNDRHNLGTSGAKIQLRRKGGRWRVVEPVSIWQS